MNAMARPEPMPFKLLSKSQITESQITESQITESQITV